MSKDEQLRQRLGWYRSPAVLPLPEGPAFLEIPGGLSQSSHEALCLWLKLMADIAAPVPAEPAPEPVSE